MKPGSKNGGAAGAFGVLKEAAEEKLARLPRPSGGRQERRLPSLVEVGQEAGLLHPSSESEAQTSPFLRTFRAPSQGWRHLSSVWLPGLDLCRGAL